MIYVRSGSQIFVSYLIQSVTVTLLPEFQSLFVARQLLVKHTLGLKGGFSLLFNNPDKLLNQEREILQISFYSILKTRENSNSGYY